MSLHTGFSPKPTGFFVWKDALAELGDVWEPLSAPQGGWRAGDRSLPCPRAATIPAICTSLSKH